MYTWSMSHDEFTKLFNYVQEMRSEMNEKFEQTASRESMDRLVNTMDRFLGRLEDADIEHAASDAQFGRLLDWARKVSAQTGIPLEGF